MSYSDSLAIDDEPEARTSGGHWRHQRRAQPAPAVNDCRFQDELLEALAQYTAVSWAAPNRKEPACAEQ
jgi:hypothetical protein